MLSPSTRYYDLTQKEEIYATHGVREHRFVTPKRRHVDVLVDRDGEFEPHSQAREAGDMRSLVTKGFCVGPGTVFPRR